MAEHVKYFKLVKLKNGTEAIITFQMADQVIHKEMMRFFCSEGRGEFLPGTKPPGYHEWTVDTAMGSYGYRSKGKGKGTGEAGW